MSPETVPVSIGSAGTRPDEPTDRSVRRAPASLRAFPAAGERFVAEFPATGGFLQRATAAVAYAIHGSTAVVDYPDWRYVRDGETIRREQRGDAGLALELAAENVFAVDMLRVDREPFHGPVDDRDTESALPDGPLYVHAGSVVHQLRGLAEQYVPVRRAVGAVDDGVLEGVLDEVRQLARYHDREGRLEGFSFADTLEQLAALIDPKRDDPAPVASEWLEWYATRSDVVERLVSEYLPTLPTERAADCYYALLARGNQQYAERALAALERQPDEKAVPALLTCLWNDDPAVAPGAISVLGTLLETRDEFTENDRGHDRAAVIDEIVGRVESSEHPAVRTAAIETLADVGLTEREDVRGAIEVALDGADEDVRAAAERALEERDSRR